MTDTSQKCSASDNLAGARISIQEINTMLNELRLKKLWLAFELGRSQESQWHWRQ